MSVNKKGITVLYEAAHPVIDIIFIHGFTGDPELTWTTKAKLDVSSDLKIAPSPSESSGGNSTPSSTKLTRSSEFEKDENSDHEKPSGLRRFIKGRASREIQPATAPRRNVFWPRDLLPSTVPDARILTYGYDTKVRHALAGLVSENTVADHGWDLLCSLDDVRRDNPSRPLLFVAHSLGGLVGKVALMKSRDSEHEKPHLYCVLTSTVGVFFFGTPHRGADPLGPGLRRILMAMAKGFALELNGKIVETLMPKGEYLREIRDSFLSLAKQRYWVIFSFQEEYGVSGLAGKKVVDDDSSRLDEPGIETPRHISSHHMGMVRFAGMDDNNYRKVASAVNVVIRNVKSTRLAVQNRGALKSFTVHQTRGSIMDVDPSLPLKKRQRREEMIKSLYFDKIDARLLSLQVAQDKTCRWLLEKHKYREWLATDRVSHHHGVLWIKGKPGAGKSILMKFLEKNARHTGPANREIVVISFFFNARGERLETSTIGLYRSLLWQLFQKVEKIQIVLDCLDTTARLLIQNEGWQVELLKQTLVDVIDLFRAHWELRIFIDAIDECDDDYVADLISFFEGLGERAVENSNNLRTCFSSRYYPTISVEKGIEIKLDEEEEHRLDIVRYINSHLRLGTSKKAEELKNQILEKSAGIFLWVALVIPILNKTCSGGKVDRFQKRLKAIPSGLHELFEMIVTRDTEDLDEFRLCIQWVLFAVRPLKIEEYFFALRQPDDDQAVASWESGDITQDVMHQFVHSSSKGLAEVLKMRSEQKEPTVQFIHEFVRDFFLSRNTDGQRELWNMTNGESLPGFANWSHNTLRDRCCEEIIRKGHSLIASLVPSNAELPVAFSKDARRLRQSVSSKLPFLEYATSYLFTHANAAAVDFPQNSFLQTMPLDAWVKFYNVFARYESHRYSNSASLVDILCGINATRLVDSLERGIDIDTTGEDGCTPLLRAAAVGHEDIVQILSKRGANLKSIDLQGLTPLSRAAEKGHKGIVQILSENGADVNLKDANGFPPLSRAAANGHGDVMRLLLEKGAHVDSKDANGWTPLLWAAANGRKGAVKLLLERGANSKLSDRKGWTPLSRAAANGHGAVIQVFLEKGADVNSKDAKDWTPLSRAAANGHKDAVKLLLENGANMYMVSLGETPLTHAVKARHFPVCKLLLDQGASVNRRN